MTVGPFAVTWGEAPTPPRVGLVHTFTAYAAAGKWLFRHHKVRKKAERTRLFESGAVRAVPVRPYLAGSRAFYARDADHAAALTKGAFAAPGDHHDCLMALGALDLMLQAHYLWPPAPGNRVRSDGVYRYAPGAAYIAVLGRPGQLARVRDTTRRTIATAVCLAIAEPQRVPALPNNYRTPDEPTALVSGDLAKLQRIHPDVDPAVLVALVRACGLDLSYPAATLALIRRFCESLGHDPERLRWSEIRALMTGGERALDRHRIEGGGRDDYFRDRNR